MNKPRVWIAILIVVVLVVAVVIVFSVYRNSTSRQNGTGTEGANTGFGETDSESIGTREEVAPDTVVPDADSEVSEGVAKPEVVIPAAPGVESKKRTFKISVNNDKFEPDTVIMKVGDISSVTFLAVDKAYEIVQPDYGFKLNIAAGESKLLEAQFNSPGKYLYYCSSCGGPESGPKGYFTVVP